MGSICQYYKIFVFLQFNFCNELKIKQEIYITTEFIEILILLATT